MPRRSRAFVPQRREPAVVLDVEKVGGSGVSAEDHRGEEETNVGARPDEKHVVGAVSQRQPELVVQVGVPSRVVLQLKRCSDTQQRRHVARTRQPYDAAE